MEKVITVYHSKKFFEALLDTPELEDEEKEEQLELKRLVGAIILYGNTSQLDITQISDELLDRLEEECINYDPHSKESNIEPNIFLEIEDIKNSRKILKTLKGLKLEREEDYFF